MRDNFHTGLAAAALAAALLVLMPLTFSGSPRDENVRPPERREFRSPSGQWTLVVRSPDPGPRVDTELLHSGLTRLPVTLPHRQGPCRAFVNDSGHFALLDEWFRAAGDHAVTVMDSSGKVLARHGFHDVARIVGVTANQLAATARVGTWMSAEPALAADGKSVTVQAGGRTLSLSLDTGALTLVSR